VGQRRSTAPAFASYARVAKREMRLHRGMVWPHDASTHAALLIIVSCAARSGAIPVRGAIAACRATAHAACCAPVRTYPSGAL
jgi:hypothetical protein